MCERIKFKNEVPFDKREQLSKKIISSYPDRVPVIIEPYKDIDPQTNRKKYLAPSDSTMSRIINEVRKYIDDINPNLALFFYVSNKSANTMPIINPSMILIPMNMNMDELYTKYHDEDGFLYISYTTESAFGSF